MAFFTGLRSQQYWWRGFGKQAGRERLRAASMQVLRLLLSQGIILATHSLKYFEVRALHTGPHRIFAVTPASGMG